MITETQKLAFNKASDDLETWKLELPSALGEIATAVKENKSLSLENAIKIESVITNVENITTAWLDTLYAISPLEKTVNKSDGNTETETSDFSEEKSVVFVPNLHDLTRKYMQE